MRRKGRTWDILMSSLKRPKQDCLDPADLQNFPLDIEETPDLAISPHHEDTPNREDNPHCPDPPNLKDASICVDPDHEYNQDVSDSTILIDAAICEDLPNLEYAPDHANLPHREDIPNCEVNPPNLKDAPIRVDPLDLEETPDRAKSPHHEDIPNREDNPHCPDPPNLKDASICVDPPDLEYNQDLSDSPILKDATIRVDPLDLEETSDRANSPHHEDIPNREDNPHCPDPPNLINAPICVDPPNLEHSLYLINPPPRYEDTPDHEDLDRVNSRNNVYSTDHKEQSTSSFHPPIPPTSQSIAPLQNELAEFLDSDGDFHGSDSDDSYKPIVDYADNRNESDQESVTVLLVGTDESLNGSDPSNRANCSNNADPLETPDPPNHVDLPDGAYHNIDRAELAQREPKQKQVRKRFPDPNSWAVNVRHHKRMKGESYTNRKGKVVSEKKPKLTDCSKCRFKCSNVIDESQQKKIHTEYWALGDTSKQKAYIITLIKEKAIERHRSRNQVPKFNKNTSRSYWLPNSEGEIQRVCLKFFCNTLSISPPFCNNALKRKGECGTLAGSDGRRGKKPSNKTPEGAENFVREHINSFPRMESHYCRHDTKKEYLAADINLSVMYRLYQDECKAKKINIVSESVYRSIFKSFEPQICFYKPKKDQCSTCLQYNAAQDKTKYENKWQEHKKREKDSFNMKNADKKKAIDDHGITFRSISFDLQAVLTVPFAGDSQIYYKRKLSVFNFCIFDFYKSDGYCYLWDEVNGKKGSSEIGTCLLKYLMNLPASVSHVTTFSDTCSGQNRNQFILAAMLYAVNKIENLQVIELKYMESGHSYLEADSMHSTIERARKHKTIYSPREWSVLIAMARQTPRPYIVNMIQYDQIYDLHLLAEETLRNVKFNTDGENVKWLNIKWLKFSKNSKVVQYKYDLVDDSTFMDIEVSKPYQTTTRTTRRSKTTIPQTTTRTTQRSKTTIPQTTTRTTRRSKKTIPQTTTRTTCRNKETTPQRNNVTTTRRKTTTKATPAGTILPKTQESSNSNQQTEIDYNKISLKSKYVDKIPVCQKKKNDLVFLLKKGIIPAEYADMILSIPSTTNVRDTVPISSSEDEDSDRDSVPLSSSEDEDKD